MASVGMSDLRGVDLRGLSLQRLEAAQHLRADRQLDRWGSDAVHLDQSARLPCLMLAVAAAEEKKHRDRSKQGIFPAQAWSTMIHSGLFIKYRPMRAP